MKVTFKQSGGFAGLARGCECDTNLLPPDEASILQSLVDKCELSRGERRQAEHARDAFSYEIIIDTGGSILQLLFDDMTIPEDAEPLLKYLQRQAKPRPLT